MPFRAMVFETIMNTSSIIRAYLANCSLRYLSDFEAAQAFLSIRSKL